MLFLNPIKSWCESPISCRVTIITQTLDRIRLFRIKVIFSNALLVSQKNTKTNHICIIKNYASESRCVVIESYQVESPISRIPLITQTFERIRLRIKVRFSESLLASHRINQRERMQKSNIHVAALDTH